MNIFRKPDSIREAERTLEKEANRLASLEWLKNYKIQHQERGLLPDLMRSTMIPGEKVEGKLRLNIAMINFAIYLCISQINPFHKEIREIVPAGDHLASANLVMCFSFDTYLATIMFLKVVGFELIQATVLQPGEVDREKQKSVQEVLDDLDYKDLTAGIVGLIIALGLNATYFQVKKRIIEQAITKALSIIKNQKNGGIIVQHLLSGLNEQSVSWTHDNEYAYIRDYLRLGLLKIKNSDDS